MLLSLKSFQLQFQFEFQINSFYSPFILLKQYNTHAYDIRAYGRFFRFTGNVHLTCKLKFLFVLAVNDKGKPQTLADSHAVAAWELVQTSPCRHRNVDVSTCASRSCGLRVLARHKSGKGILGFSMAMTMTMSVAMLWSFRLVGLPSNLGEGADTKASQYSRTKTLRLQQSFEAMVVLDHVWMAFILSLILVGSFRSSFGPSRIVFEMSYIVFKRFWTALKLFLDQFRWFSDRFGASRIVFWIFSDHAFCKVFSDHIRSFVNLFGPFWGHLGVVGRRSGCSLIVVKE